MKKFLSVVAFWIMIITSANLCLAYERNEYDNSPYYVFVTTSQGHIYLDLRTVNVHDYNPPHYQIAGEFIWVGHFDKGISRRFEVAIRYNFDTKETYVRRDGYWTKSDVNGDSNFQKSNRKFADALFSAAYGMDFYGSSFEANIADYSSNEEVRKYTEQIKKNPNDSVAYNNLGSSYAELGQYEQAIQNFSIAIQLNPNYDIAYRNRGLTYYYLLQYNRAIQDFSIAIQLNPNDSNGYNNRGSAYKKLGQHERAIQDYNKAIELNPNDSKAYYNRGCDHYNLKQYKLAIQDYNKAIQLNPNDADYYNNRGIAYDDLGQYERAIQDYNKAIQLNPNDADYYYNRGFTYEKIGNIIQAESDFAKASALGYNG